MLPPLRWLVFQGLGLGLILNLAACGGGDNKRGSASVPREIKGVVALQSLEEGAQVAAHCANGESYSTRSKANGLFELQPPLNAYPCLLQASDSAALAQQLPTNGVLYSYAGSAGQANITPLTHLAVVLAYRSTTPAEGQVGLNMSGPLADLRAALVDGGYVDAAVSFVPFSAQVVAGSPWLTLHQSVLQAAQADGSVQNLEGLAQRYAQGQTDLPPRLELDPS